MAQAEKPQQNIEGNGNFPKDLLQRLISRSRISHRVCQEVETDGESEDIELSLGLSLNGRFGVDPKAKKLTRSSSIPDFIINNPTKESSAFAVPVVRSTNNSSSSSLNLVRTCSLPTETDEEWRKRKEIQMLRRMEAKRKRSEKQRNLKVTRDRKDHNFEEDKRENGTISNNCNGSTYHQEQFFKKFNGLFGVGGGGSLPPPPPPPPPSQGSTGSQGSGSSGSSESENQPVQGISKCSEARSPVSVQSLSECEQKLAVMPPSTINGKLGYPLGVAMENNRSSQPIATNGGAKEMARNVLEDMPCVSTKGDGPNGKRIEGFLYRYRKGEEVRIVCVCHGSFLSPAEFVKHAGGGDVAHPLKHIVVNPHPLL